jgi:aspartyl-tRNA(Asn)/glutamyl-tRNA(Gln) amidotransferase subunit B
VIEPAWIEQVRSQMPELPAAMARRFERDDKLPADDAAMMTQNLGFARYYEMLRDACANPKLAANWLMGEVSKRLNAEVRTIEASPVAPPVLAALIRRVADGTVSNNGARQVFDALWSGEGASALGAPDAAARVDTLIEAKGLKQMNDSGALEAIVDDVLAHNTKSVDEYRAGKDKAFNALVGQVMKASKGKANPAQAGELLKRKLG